MWEKFLSFLILLRSNHNACNPQQPLAECVICTFQTRLFVFGKWIWNHWPCLWGLLIYWTYELTSHCWWVHRLARPSHVLMKHLFCLRRKDYAFSPVSGSTKHKTILSWTLSLPWDLRGGRKWDSDLGGHFFPAWNKDLWSFMRIQSKFLLGPLQGQRICLSCQHSASSTVMLDKCEWWLRINFPTLGLTTSQKSHTLAPVQGWMVWGGVWTHGQRTGRTLKTLPPGILTRCPGGCISWWSLVVSHKHWAQPT